MNQSAEFHPRAPDARVAGLSQAELPAIGCWQLLEPLVDRVDARVYRARPAGRAGDWPADYVVKLAAPLAAGDARRAGDALHAGDLLASRLLQREAFVGRQVSHPNLAPVLAAQVDAPPYFLVLPLLEGKTLARGMAEGRRLSLAEALWTARQAAEALAELHRCGWRHGDVKPANLLLAPSGHVTLIDLGFAQRLVAAPPRDELLLASPAYAAPECLCPSRPAGGQADVYSLGVVLYELLADSRPFVEDELAQLAAAHLQTMAPDVRKAAPTVPQGVAQLVRRMLAKEPLRRPSSQELVEQLIRLEIESFDARGWAA